MIERGVEAVAGIGFVRSASLVEIGEALLQVRFGCFQECGKIGVAQEGSGKRHEEDPGLAGMPPCRFGV